MQEWMSERAFQWRRDCLWVIEKPKDLTERQSSQSQKPMADTRGGCRLREVSQLRIGP